MLDIRKSMKVEVSDTPLTSTENTLLLANSDEDAVILGLIKIESLGKRLVMLKQTISIVEKLLLPLMIACAIAVVVGLFHSLKLTAILSVVGIATCSLINVAMTKISRETISLQVELMFMNALASELVRNNYTPGKHVRVSREDV